MLDQNRFWFESRYCHNLMYVIMKDIKAFKCDFCTKLLQLKHAMVLHEKYCKKNPKNIKICFDCVFCESIKISYKTDYQKEWLSGEKISDGYFCTKKKVGIYTLNAERKLVKRYPETFKNQIPMSNKCDSFVAKPLNE